MYVNETRIAELRAIDQNTFDLRKLVRLCEELNVTSDEGCLYSTGMLVRSILDYAPPIFGKTSFTEVASNYGGKSFKEAMQRLEESARKIADGYLHTRARKKETLPVPQQVNFTAELDLLISEIVNILS